MKNFRLKLNLFLLIYNISRKNRLELKHNERGGYVQFAWSENDSFYGKQIAYSQRCAMLRSAAEQFRTTRRSRPFRWAQLAERSGDNCAQRILYAPYGALAEYGRIENVSCCELIFSL